LEGLLRQIDGLLNKIEVASRAEYFNEELEITDINRLYLEKDQLHVEIMERGYAWLDTGTHESLLEAGQFISTLERRQGLKVSCPEEIAFRNGWINASQLEQLATPLLKNTYGQYLMRLINAQ
jgi:glucose-1-phosphate thymidylyltransferase